MLRYKAFILALAALSGMVLHGSGFGLYQASAKGQALGGAVVGKAVDASANFYNPATLTDFTNIVVTAGFVTEHPRARVKVEGEPSTAMDPGVFWLPSFGLVVPLWWDFALGFIALPEYGLGTEYDSDWELANSSQQTTVQSFTLNPNLAYAICERWSIAAGMRFLFFDFEQYSIPVPGMLHHRLKGDNRLRDFGWQAGTKYQLLDNLSLGLLYKSRINVHVDGKSELDGFYGLEGMTRRVDAETELEMPDSITAGFNWDITDTWHLGGSFAWTQWSTIGELDFNLGGTHTPCKLNWEDTYRVMLAPSWNFADDWLWMFSYGYETDCTGGQESTMLPCADRHMLTTGISWNCWRNLELTLSYGIIIMAARPSQAADREGVLREYEAYRGISHTVGFSVTYRF